MISEKYKNKEDIEIDILQRLKYLANLLDNEDISYEQFSESLIHLEDDYCEEIKSINEESFTVANIWKRYIETKNKANKSIGSISYNELQYLLKIDLYESNVLNNKMNDTRSYVATSATDISTINAISAIINTIGLNKLKEKLSEEYANINKKYDFDNYIVYNSIKDLMKKYRINQEELSDLMQINRATLSNIIKGKTIPSIEYCFRLTKIFNCKIEDIFHYDILFEKDK